VKKGEKGGSSCNARTEKHKSPVGEAKTGYHVERRRPPKQKIPITRGIKKKKKRPYLEGKLNEMPVQQWTGGERYETDVKKE